MNDRTEESGERGRSSRKRGASGAGGADHAGVPGVPGVPGTPGTSGAPSGPGALAPLQESAWERAALCLRTVAHPVRLQMITLLLQDQYTVGELAHACGISNHAASGHLGRMKDRGLLRAERVGRQVHYRVQEPALQGIIGCVHARFAGPEESD